MGHDIRALFVLLVWFTQMRALKIGSGEIAPHGFSALFQRRELDYIVYRYPRAHDRRSIQA